MNAPGAIGRSLCLAFAAGVSMGGCGASSATPTGSSAASGPSSHDVASSEPSMAPAPTGTASGPGASPAVVIDLGMVGVTPGGSRVTVYSFGPSDHSPEPPAGSAWLEADIEWCLTPTVTTDMSVGQVRYELVLELRDDATIVPDATAGSPDEVYSSDGTFTGNECVRGALVFAVESGAIPEYLVLQGASGGMRWALA